MQIVIVHIKGNKTFVALSQGAKQPGKHYGTIRFFSSTQRVVMHESPMILDLYASDMPKGVLVMYHNC
eukprot:scaffold106206_cov37-Prasinocladus_malaysianus.AAC.2